MVKKQQGSKGWHGERNRYVPWFQGQPPYWREVGSLEGLARWHRSWGPGQREGVQQTGYCTSPGKLQDWARQGQKRSQEA